MGNKDLTEKILEDYNDVFADIVNVLLFNGERRVKESELENTKTISQYKSSENILHEEERDVSKFWNSCNVRIAMVGIENQTQPEKQMPIRIYGYEGASYREQLGNNYLYPVVTIILYFGTDRHWNHKKTLKEIIEIPKALDKYVNDIKINVFEIAWLSDEIIEKFTSDFKIVAKFFVEKRKNKDYIPNDKTIIKHVDALLKLLSAMTNDNRYEKILSEAEGKKVKNMCEVAERLEQKGKTENLTEIIIRMISKEVGVEEIADLTGADLAFVEEIAAKIK